MKQSLTLVVLGLSLAVASFTATAKTHKNPNYFCENDCKREFKFFRNYAHQGSSLADLMLAIMYYQGKGTDVNAKLGNRHLLKSARAGEPGAQYQLGYFLMHGMYMEQNVDKALNWFTRAAKNNKKGANAKIAQIKSWQSSGNIPPSRAKARLVVENTETAGQNKPVKVDEVIAVYGDFSYSQVLSAAKDQTCNSSCPPAWNVVTAPLIVLSEDG